MKTVQYKFKNGNYVKDLVSGITGIINAQSTWLNGCIRYSVQPKAEKGKNVMPECWWLDEEQIEIIDAGLNLKSTRTGGPSEKSPRY